MKQSAIRLACLSIVIAGCIAVSCDVPGNTSSVGTPVVTPPPDRAAAMTADAASGAFLYQPEEINDVLTGENGVVYTTKNIIRLPESNENYYRYYPKINYRTDKKVHLYFPKTGVSRPLVLLLPGGAFKNCDYLTMEPIARMFAQSGYVAATVEYRTWDGDEKDRVTAPYELAEFYAWIGTYWAMQDIRAAVKFLLGYKDLLRINENNVFLYGFSAGAISVLMAAHMQDEELAVYSAPDNFPYLKAFYGGINDRVEPAFASVAFSGRFQGVAAVEGAFSLTPGWFFNKQDTVLTVLLHNTPDVLVPFGADYSCLGFANDQGEKKFIFLWGSGWIKERYEAWGGREGTGKTLVLLDVTYSDGTYPFHNPGQENWKKHCLQTLIEFAKVRVP